MVGHIGAEATAAIGIVSSSTWLLHGILVGLYTAFSIQIAQYLGADRQQDARGVLRQSMLFNLILGLGAAAFGVGISRFLPGWLGADISLQADAGAYFAIWSAALPFTMAMGMYAAMLRATGDALTPGLISVLVCVLDVVFNFFLINPTRQILLFGQSVTVWGAGLESRVRAWHSAFHDHRRSAGAGRPAAAGRPALHPKARQLAHHLRLSAQSLAGGYTAGR